ncbi:LIM domain-containing protein PLIM2b-like, partial [Hibiscus syriacus]|uniref:LIM domain-containing protein PLIM2b-like n=1 Tax=Hibiscus syriacus TaxID=106335 RepID=UPI0019243F4C
ISTCSSMDGVIYCKTHFEQLFKESGNYSRNFHTTKTEKQNDGNATSNKFSSMFSITQDECSACQKTLYPLEKVTKESECFHKSCFKCSHGGCHLTHSSYAALNGVLYRTHHFAQLFKEKGSYTHVLEATQKKANSTAPTESKEASSVQESGENES